LAEGLLNGHVAGSSVASLRPNLARYIPSFALCIFVENNVKIVQLVERPLAMLIIPVPTDT
jgi:hypothetical protein